MPSSDTAKTASARNRSPAALVVLVISVFLVCSGALQLFANSGDNLAIGSSRFKAEIVRTPEQQERGLSGRSGLANDQAMLFDFANPGIHCFWMKDMRFSIDILWFDTAGRLAHIERSVSPATYPESFCPAVPARYVVELPAGTVDSLGIALGDSLSLDDR